ncbi:MAG: peptide ABC transporter substrate-binding protein [Clostridiales bacterium]|nr:peptide ABC transporter substrate-binding protein [Clostridiales bacterium]
MKEKVKRISAIILSLILLFSLAACGGAGKGLKVCIASEPDTLDPALNSAVDGATMIAHLFSGLAKLTHDENGKYVIAPDVAEELVEGVENEDGTVTYTYTIRDDVKWSDGKPVTAHDFEFAWNRAASTELAADYSYMFEIIDGFAEMWETDADGNFVNPDAKLNIKAVDEKTFEVTITNAVPYWDELLAFPVFFPVREDVVSNEAWATDPKTYVSNGAYKMTEWKHNSVIVIEKNPNYHDADSILMEKIEFYLSDDSNNMLTNFKNGTWLFIDDVPTNEIETLKAEYPDEFVIAGQIGTYYLSWNVNAELLPEGSNLTGEEAEAARAEIRQAISLLIDRNHIVEAIAQGGQVPASSFVAMGMTEPDGSEFYLNAGPSEDYAGYYDVSAEAFESNFEKAMEILKKYYTYDESSKKFTDFPAITYLYNTSEGHKAIGEYIQSALASVGITINLENQEWNTFLNTRKEGNYTVARNGWVADYNDPICFLDMWTSGSGNNDIQFGKDEHAGIAMYDLDLTEYGYDVNVKDGTWAETYDVLINTIKSETDPEKRFALMHLAEDMLMETGATTPIYFYTDLYMISKKVDGFFANPLGYKYFMYCTVNN